MSMTAQQHHWYVRYIKQCWTSRKQMVELWHIARISSSVRQQLQCCTRQQQQQHEHQKQTAGSHVLGIMSSQQSRA